MLHLVLADAELEPVPEALRDHPQVRAHAEKEGVDPTAMVLDATHHHAAMQDLDEGDRRGRPDIVHLWLLTVLESRACTAGLVRPWVHTRQDAWIAVDPETRLPKHLVRFEGLMRQLLTEGRVGPKDKDLLSLEEDVPLGEALADLPEPVVVLDPEADPVPPARLVADLGGDATLVVGGFPSGTYRSKLSGRRVALPGGAQLAWTATGEVVAHVASQRIDG